MRRVAEAVINGAVGVEWPEEADDVQQGENEKFRRALEEARTARDRAALHNKGGKIPSEVGEAHDIAARYLRRRLAHYARRLINAAPSPESQLPWEFPEAADPERMGSLAQELAIGAEWERQRILRRISQMGVSRASSHYDPARGSAQ